MRPPVADPGVRGGSHAARRRWPDYSADRPGLSRAGGNDGAADQPGQRAVSDVRFNEPGDLATVLRVLYLVFNEGYTGDVDLAAEAIRLTRQLAAMTDDEETAGLLALMLLHHARRPARTRRDGSLVPLAEQDRSRGTPISLPRELTSCRQRWPMTDWGSTRRKPPSPLCTPMLCGPRRPIGCRLSAGTTSCSGSPAARLSSSTGPSRSARPMEPGRSCGPGRRRSRPAPPHRRLGVPAREGG